MFENKIQIKKKRFKHLKQESNFVQTLLLFSYLFVLQRKNTPNEEYILYHKQDSLSGNKRWLPDYRLYLLNILPNNKYFQQTFASYTIVRIEIKNIMRISP